MGFDSINPYGVNNFSNIKEKLNTDEQQDMYYQKWMNNYTKIFKSNNKPNKIDWKIREWRSIKEIYAAAILFKEAECTIKNGCIASHYFALYYSIFHGMLSTICFDTNITLEQISNINHSKVGNQFRNTFCNGKSSIISEEIYNVFNEFKYYREYYSYTTPLNMTFYDPSHLKKLKYFLIQCFQLTNLHSLILEKSYHKHSKGIKIQGEEEFLYTLKSFNILVSKPNVDNKHKYILDAADENIFHEMILDGIDFQCIGIQLDHTFDEFRAYNCEEEFLDNLDNKEGTNSSEVYSFIYDSIM